ncbi:MAG: DinB family protein [Lentisphaeria bacterium]|nr:DinB family protein [Lentisphaeria bacterium]
MLSSVDILRQTRKNLINKVNSLSDEQLLAVPEGMNNNILWNVAHLQVTLKLLIYKLSGLETGLDEQYINMLRKGSSPEDWNGFVPDIEKVKEALIADVDQLEKDIEAGIFENYNEYPTSFGVTLSSIEDAINFNTNHENIHLGVILAMAHLV